MYLARGLADALALALLSMCCWGSWSNTLVYCGDRLRFELYYFDYAMGVLLTALFFAVTLGMAAFSGFLEEYWYPHDWNVLVDKQVLALSAGAIFNLANLLLVKGIQMCGLAVAFPLGIGTALVLGTVLTHFMEASKGGSVVLLFSGVAVAFLAVCTTSLTHRLKDAAAKESGDDTAEENESESESEASSSDESKSETPGKPSMARKLIVCVVAGMLMSLWSPLNARAQDGFGNSERNGLSPYGAFVAFSVGIMLSTFLLIPLVLACPLDKGSPVPLRVAARDYKVAPCKVHAYGLIGGAIWALGTLANSVSGERLSFAASYAIGQSAPMVAMCWGVFHFHEFDGVPAVVKALLTLVFLLYITSIALIALSH